MYTEEIWKDIPEYCGLYQVSSRGNIMSLKFNKQKILKPCIDSTGYLSIKLSKNSKRKNHHVHVLVAKAFLNHVSCGHKLIVDHIDNDKYNNNLNNLQIITQRENIKKEKNNNSSGYNNIYLNKRTGKWIIVFNFNKKPMYLGKFKNKKVAYAFSIYSLENYNTFGYFLTSKKEYNLKNN